MGCIQLKGNIRQRCCSLRRLIYYLCTYANLAARFRVGMPASLTLVRRNGLSNSGALSHEPRAVHMGVTLFYPILKIQNYGLGGMSRNWFFLGFRVREVDTDLSQHDSWGQTSTNAYRAGSGCFCLFSDHVDAQVPAQRSSARPFFSQSAATGTAEVVRRRRCLSR